MSDRSEAIYLSTDRAAELLSPELTPPRLRLVPFRGELWLAETSTGLLVNVAKRHLLPLGIWTVGVRGTKYYAPMVKAADIPPGTRVQLVREPANVNDSNAVAIMANDLMLGYWNKQMARKLARALDAGEELEAVILAGTASGKATERVRVLAAAPGLVAYLTREPGPDRTPRPERRTRQDETWTASPRRSLLARLFGH